MQSLEIANPPWVASFVDWNRRYRTDEEKMHLAIGLSRQNILHATGGPFGAAVFEVGTGRLVGVGVNSVVRLTNCTLHGEMMAFMMAQAQVRSFTLDGADGPRHEMVTSCEPCAMCIGAALWSGVHRIVAGAAGEDARAIGFDEGPVFAESYAYLERRDIEIVRGVLREQAREVLREYGRGPAPIYNGKPRNADTAAHSSRVVAPRVTPLSLEPRTHAIAVAHEPTPQEQTL